MTNTVHTRNIRNALDSNDSTMVHSTFSHEKCSNVKPTFQNVFNTFSIKSFHHLMKVILHDPNALYLKNNLDSTEMKQINTCSHFRKTV